MNSAGLPRAAAPRSMRERLATRLAHAAFLLLRPMTLGVRGVAIDAQGRVMLVRHTYVEGWHFPGGGVEAGETLVEALTREVAEEANLVLLGRPLLHGIFFNGRASRRDHVAVYVVRAFRQTGPRAADREILEARFFALDDLPAGTSPATRARLAEIFERAAISQRW